MAKPEQSHERADVRDAAARETATQAPHDIATGVVRKSGVARELYDRELDVLLKGRLCAHPKYRDRT